VFAKLRDAQPADLAPVRSRIVSAPIPRRAAWQRLGVTTDGCIVTHFCIDCAFNTNSHFHIVNHMKRLTRLTAITILLTAGLGLADTATVTVAHAQTGAYATSGHGGGCVVCRGSKRR
jgi:hypothetical protein